MRRGCVDENDRPEERDNEERERYGEDKYSFFPGGYVGVLLVDLVWLGVAREEDEEEKHSICTSAKSQNSDKGDVHEEETRPLYADLCNSEQSSGTGEPSDLLATSHVPCALGKR